MSDFKIGFCENPKEGTVHIQFNGKMTDISDSEIFFVLSFNNKVNKDNVMITSNVDKGNFAKFMRLLQISIDDLVETFDKTDKMSPSEQVCENILNSHRGTL